ncbi:MAG: hypothetical protein JOY62_18940 [Acidobacteriaceae bacterium]|nr:hypothetical protein [Acidobacteriaceae bacterium]MBV9782045.1 hypothetical protein [Acidobacteriaceae bacterium]
MKYRVVFRERSNREGEKAEDPASFLEAQLDNETVLASTFVERTGPDAKHSSEILEEDDDFLSLATEVWEYDVADGKDQAFQEALQNSEMVIEFEPLEESDELGVS